MAHDPDPRPGLSIGITGHRPNKLPKAAIPRIEQQLRNVMDAVERTAVANNAGRPIRLISGFAEGVDQMAVAAAPSQWTIEAILPFPKDEYLKDFEQSAAGNGRDVRSELFASLARASSVTELPTPPAGARDDGYLVAGRAMLRQIGLLIAVWDGEEAKSGGTGQIAREASEAGIPVVWLSANAERDPVLIERFQNGAPIVSAQPWTTALTLARPTRAARA
jgi:hypothetical protein